MVSSGVLTSTSTTARSRVASMARIADASASAERKAPNGVVAERSTARRSARTGCSTTVTRCATAAILPEVAQEPSNGGASPQPQRGTGA